MNSKNERLCKYMLLNKILMKTEANGKSLPEIEISDIVINSRNAHEGSLFVCIVGSFTDGHKYVHGAYENGCRCFVCEKRVVLPDDAIIIMVNDTRALLAKMACRFYKNPSKKLKMIGITGTKGKTTTALMICSLLNYCGKNCGYIGSNGFFYNKTWYKSANTTPESLILQEKLSDMLSSGVEYVVLEVSSQALYTHRVDGVRFDTLAYTNLARDHIGSFEHPTMEHYIESKARLFSEKRGASLCVYNCDDSMHERITGAFDGERTSYSISGNGDINAKNQRPFSEAGMIGTDFDILYKGQKFEARLPMPGRFNIANAICAFSVCSKYIKNTESIINGMLEISVDGRFEIIHTAKGATFVIDYAHNGLSLGSALEELRKICKGRLICLFGSVGDRTFERREELGRVAGKYADFCIVTSDNPGYEAPEDILRDIYIHVKKENCPYISFVDRKEAIKYAYTMAEKDDIVLLAGKGHESYQLIRGVKEPFSERKILEETKKNEQSKMNV